MISSIDRVLVVGVGWTGRQIAAQCAAFGVATWMVDDCPETVQAAMAWAAQHAQELVANDTWNETAVDAVRANLRVCDPGGVASMPFDLIIECVPEQASLKRKVLKAYSQDFNSPTLLVSNSSYFVPSQLSRYVTSPDRFAHLHFHVPVHAATLVDIVPCAECNPEVLIALEVFAKRIGQTPIIQTVENPGYIFNWLLQFVLSGALELVDKQVANPQQVDLAWTTVTKMPLGPFGIIDRIGVDVVYQVMQNARWSSNDPKLERLMEILQPLIDSGRLGWKTGSGFYEYTTQQSVGTEPGDVL